MFCCKSIFIHFVRYLTVRINVQFPRIDWKNSLKPQHSPNLKTTKPCESFIFSWSIHIYYYYYEIGNGPTDVVDFQTLKSRATQPDVFPITIRYTTQMILIIYFDTNNNVCGFQVMLQDCTIGRLLRSCCLSPTPNCNYYKQTRNWK